MTTAEPASSISLPSSLHRPLPNAVLFLGGVLLLGDFLTWNAAPGLGWGLLTLALGAGALMRAGFRVRQPTSQLLLAWVFLLAAALVLTGSLLAVLLAPLAIGCLTFGALAGRIDSLTALLIRVVRGAATTPMQSARDLREADWNHHVAIGLFRSWLWPVVLVVVFAVLLGIANPIIATWWGQLGEALTDLGIPAPLRVVSWWLLAFLAWAIARAMPAMAAMRVGATSTMPADRTRVACRFLLLANGLFAVQHVLDLRYLVGGTALPTGMTYAGYAHRGSYTLIVTALLAAGIVLLWFRPGSACCRDRTARLLVFGWLGQNALLVAAAGWRLGLYIDAYGLTRWRIAAAVWMLLVGGGLLIVGWRILRELDQRWLRDAIATLLLALLTGTALYDSDALIAWHNVQHCREAGTETLPLDMEYLADLSPTARPAVEWLAHNSRDPMVAQAASQLAHQQGALLEARLKDWRQWTLNTWRATAQDTATVKQSESK